jgi:chemotaxis protein methyltransferase CheR
VLIYFTTTTTKMVVEMFADALNPGGYLYLGHAETLLNVSARFERHIHDGSFYYRKKTVPVAESEKPARKETPSLSRSAAAVEVHTGVPLRAAAPAFVAPVENINPEDLFMKGLGLLHQEHFAEAAAAFSGFLRKKPGHTGAILGRGQIHLAQGRYDEALECCEEALALDDLLPGGYFLRGLVFEITERIEDAFEEYRKAVLLKIDFVMPHYQLGKLCFRTGDTKSSLREFRNSVKLLEKTAMGAVIPFSGGLSREVFLEQAIKDASLVESAIATQER